jgi:membrane-associated phospholipid phosphatase
MTDPLYMLDLIGYYGPVILFISSIFLLYKKSNYLSSYIIGIILSCFSNLVLKEIIKQPRPKGSMHILNSTENNNHKRIFSSDIYGMPSGHAQHVFYSTIFIHLVFKNTNITLLYLFISLLTLIQRVKYQNHYITQVIVGGFIGGLIAYYMYMYANKKIVGKLVPKREDNAKDVA